MPAGNALEVILLANEVLAIWSQDAGSDARMDEPFILSFQMEITIYHDIPRSNGAFPEQTALLFRLRTDYDERHTQQLSELFSGGDENIPKIPENMQSLTHDFELQSADIKGIKEFIQDVFVFLMSQTYLWDDTCWNACIIPVRCCQLHWRHAR